MKLKKLIFATFTSVILLAATAQAAETDTAVRNSAETINNTNASSKYHFKYSHKSFNSLEGGTWHKGRGWMYTKLDGTDAIGWTLIDGDYHYFDENGWMYAGCTTPDGYYVDENGVLSVTGTDTSSSPVTEDYISGLFEFRYYDKNSTCYYDPTENEKYVYLLKKDASTITVSFNNETLDYIKIDETIYENMQNGNRISIAYDGDIYIYTGDKRYFYSKC